MKILKILLYMIWLYFFAIEISILIMLPSMLSGGVIMICCSFAGIVIMGFAKELNNKKVKRSV